MIRKRLSRLATVFTTAALAVMLVGVGSVSANPPHWSMTVTKLPPTVKAGADAGFVITITNAGPSNIATLFLVDDAGNTSYVGTPTQGSCLAAGVPLKCTFGTLRAGKSVTVTVAHTVGTTALTVTFQANTNGSTFSDTGNTSHGDTLSKTATTSVSNSPNFGGGFIVGSTTVLNYQTVGSGNKQASSVVSPASLIPVTVEDGITTGVPCTGAKCANAFGEWTELHVNGGAPYGSAFKVTLLIWGGAVPGGVSLGSIVILHTLDNGTTTTISTHCTPTTGTPTNAECLTATRVGSNYRIVVWIFQNGNLRGGY